MKEYRRMSSFADSFDHWLSSFEAQLLMPVEHMYTSVSNYSMIILNQVLILVLPNAIVSNRPWLLLIILALPNVRFWATVHAQLLK